MKYVQILRKSTTCK